jgi:hypothetical protein
MHADAPVTPRRLSSRPFTAGFLIVMIEVATVSVCPAAPFSISAQLVSIGQNFTGSSFSNRGFILPDTMGAVGPTSFVEILNGRYAVYDKGSGSVIQTNTLNQFWSNAGAAPIKYAFDPRGDHQRQNGVWRSIIAAGRGCIVSPSPVGRL